VFHLSDSFYFCIKNADVVALELDPQLWQDQLFRYQNMQNNLKFYTQGSPTDYLNEKSFQLEKYEERIKSALSEEPTIINGLLYRTFQPRADFEEDTYLDLYIYQTGKKLGKLSTGVENYFETEKLILEATQDMMKDKKRSRGGADGESFYEIERKTQDAYRKGDLDLLDSLEHIMEPSSAYMEKFLYRRNEIQAASIDSILKTHSLFVGVGAAHLPGDRGVIELLRKMGYTLRPINMRDQDGVQRDDIDKVKVPVKFSSFSSEDKSFTVRLPGKLYKRADSHAGESWQYADMSNGAYYMITRVKTHSGMVGQQPETVLRKIDSLLYENIPGKILKKIPITKDGYRGFDITNKTRRGDIQRYNILETPYEALVFKMSGTGGYVEGKEAEEFFGSIELKKQQAATWTTFQPARGGFEIQFPQVPAESMNMSSFDGVPRWEYEANDPATGDAYLVWKKSIQNFRFLEEDTFDLSLMEESFRLSDWIANRQSRQFSTWKGYACLSATYTMKDGSLLRARFLVNGPHYYLLAARTKNKNQLFTPFFNSFAFLPYAYPVFRQYTDSVVNIAVSTPVIPDIDVDVRRILERATSEDFLNAVSEYNNYWPHNKTALFRDDSTGEAMYVSVQPYPKYYYPKDSASFWQSETNENKLKDEFIIRSKHPFRFNDSVQGIKYIFADTASSRVIHNWIFLKNNRLYRVINLRDSSSDPGAFIGGFYSSIRPLDKLPVQNLYANKLDLFFNDFYSKDSALSKHAKDAISNVYFGPAGLERLLHAIYSLPYNQKDYFSTKTKLINELGYITDSSVLTQVLEGLKTIYARAKDTTTLQTAVFRALARNKTRASYELLKTLLVQDPPVFNSTNEYNSLFQDIGDSLRLARILFPDLLQLSSVDDYKDGIQTLLTSLVDSNYLTGEDYEPYFSKLFFEAKIQLKRQQGKDENQSEQKTQDDNVTDYENTTKEESDGFDELEEYSILLMPFYDRNASVSNFFTRLLRSKDGLLRLNTAVLLLKNDKQVPDSVLVQLAASDKYRSILLTKLEFIHRTERFPKKYYNQLDIARSQIVSSYASGDMASVRYVDKRLIGFKGSSGYVYFFSYKIHGENECQMGISGLQPVTLSEVSSNNDLVKLTGKRIRKDQPVADQFSEQLNRLLFSKHKSAASFYLDSDYYLSRNEDEE
jgi:uncharacterized protein YbaP (TraB family)